MTALAKNNKSGNRVKLASSLSSLGLLAGVALGLLTIAPPTAQAQIQHQITPGKGDTPKIVHVGATVTAIGTLTNNVDAASDSWIVTNAVNVLFPSGGPAGCTTPITNVITLPGTS